MPKPLTRPAILLTLAIAFTGCADVATNVAINVAGPILVVPAMELAGAGIQAAGEAAMVSSTLPKPSRMAMGR